MANKLIPLAKGLRKRTTDTEQLLWRHLRAKHFEGLKFRRQQPIGVYIVDFVCFEKKIIVELDGGSMPCQQKCKTIVEGISGLKHKGTKYYGSGTMKC